MRRPDLEPSIAAIIVQCEKRIRIVTRTFPPRRLSFSLAVIDVLDGELCAADLLDLGDGLGEAAELIVGNPLNYGKHAIHEIPARFTKIEIFVRQLVDEIVVEKRDRLDQPRFVPGCLVVMLIEEGVLFVFGAARRDVPASLSADSKTLSERSAS